MKYKIEAGEKRVDIEVTAIRGKQEKLLEAFRQCRQGRCACPTREYSKLESLEIETGEDTIRLKLRAKAGEELNKSEINKCLEYTREKLTKDQ